MDVILKQPLTLTLDVARFRSFIFVGLPCGQVARQALPTARSHGFVLLRTLKPGRWAFTHNGQGPLASVAQPHNLDLRVTSEGEGISLLDFRFYFNHELLDKSQIHRWVTRFRETLLNDLYPEPIRGVVASDGTHVEFPDGTPPFYRREMINHLGVRSRLAREGDALAFAGVVGAGFTLALLFALLPLVHPSPLWPILVFSLFVGIATVAAFMSRARYRLSPMYPLRVRPTWDRLVVEYGKGGLFEIRWPEIVRITSETTQGLGTAWKPGRNFTTTRVQTEYVVICKVKHKPLMFLVNDDVRAAIEERLSQNTGDASSQEASAMVELKPPGTAAYVRVRPMSREEANLRKLIQRSPASGLLGSIYVSLADDEQTILSAVTTGVYEDATLLALADHARGLDYWELGTKVYGELSARRPTDPKIIYHLGGCLLQQGKTSELRAALGKFQVSNSPNAKICVILALAADRDADPEGALHHIGEAVDLDPNSLDALFLWFDVVSAIGGVGRAIAELETVTGSRADAWGPPFVLGIRTGQGGYEKVREYLATAFERSQNEHTTPAYLELLIRRGDLKAGLDAATRASETPGADSLGETGWYWIAMAFRLCNLPDRARWALGKAGLGVFPDWDQDVVRTYRGL